MSRALPVLVGQGFDTVLLVLPCGKAYWLVVAILAGWARRSFRPCLAVGGGPPPTHPMRVGPTLALGLRDVLGLLLLCVLGRLLGLRNDGALRLQMPAVGAATLEGCLPKRPKTLLRPRLLPTGALIRRLRVANGLGL